MQSLSPFPPNVELTRLNEQHDYLKKYVYDWKLVYDDAARARLSEGGAVLDSGTGTGEHSCRGIVPIRRILSLRLTT